MARRFHMTDVFRPSGGPIKDWGSFPPGCENCGTSYGCPGTNNPCACSGCSNCSECSNCTHSTRPCTGCSFEMFSIADRINYADDRTLQLMRAQLQSLLTQIATKAGK